MFDTFNTKFLSLDLELNNAQDHSTPNPKIIQVGIAIGSQAQSEEEWVIRKWYIDPEEPIYPFITDLTGITDQDIAAHAISHQHLAQELGSLVDKHQCFMNPITWGGGDSTELKQEFRDRTIQFPHFGRRWVDVKTFYTFAQLARRRNPAGGLRSAMGQFGLPFRGQAHRADVDATNTLRFFFHLLDRQQSFEGLLGLVKPYVR